tara:strand:+ start:736 stop:1650 length:915 start_codon:yes stop_codon:yes gene_type:complete
MKVCQYKECEVTSLVMKYLEPLMQLLSGTMKDYNMQMRTTKCLNTAVMLTYILGGSDRLKKVEYCEVSKINNRYDKKSNKLQHKLNIFNKLKQDLSKKNIRKRYFYYILMTNNNMNKSNALPHNADKSKFFPGHVFIIDKFPVCNNEEPKYNIYQSYINQYDLKGHYKRNKNSMNLKNNNIGNLLSGIKNIIANPTWNNEAVNFWNELTFVDTQNLIDYKTNKINLCYSKIRIDYCYKQFRNFIKKHKETLEYDIKNNLNLNKYNISNVNTYDEFYVKQLTPDNLLKELNNLYSELGDKIKIYE